jgi:hypothetical protein
MNPGLLGWRSDAKHADATVDDKGLGLAAQERRVILNENHP